MCLSRNWCWPLREWARSRCCFGEEEVALKLEVDSKFSEVEAEVVSKVLGEVSGWRSGRCSLVLWRESSETPKWI